MRPGLVLALVAGRIASAVSAASPWAVRNAREPKLATENLPR
jgi:hypothetical protein